MEGTYEMTIIDDALSIVRTYNLYVPAHDVIAFYRLYFSTRKEDDNFVNFDIGEEKTVRKKNAQCSFYTCMRLEHVKSARKTSYRIDYSQILM